MKENYDLSTILVLLFCGVILILSINFIIEISAIIGWFKLVVLIVAIGIVDDFLVDFYHFVMGKGDKK